MHEDEYLLSEFQKALKKNTQDILVNLDEKFNPKFQFFVKPYEEILRHIGTRVVPHKWSYHRIGLVKSGGADFSCGIHKFKAEKNTLVLIPPRVINGSNWLAETTGYLMVFNLDFFAQNQLSHKYFDNKRILQSTVRPYIRLTQEQADRVEAIYKTILEEKETDDPHRNELIALKVVELLILADRLYTDDQDTQSQHAPLELVRQFSDLLEQHFTTERNVNFYASRLGVHPNYLNALVKTHTGLTLKESIQSRVLLEAKYLLHTTRLSIKEVSNNLGFHDPNYFTSFFKRQEKQSPVSYRSSIL